MVAIIQCFWQRTLNSLQRGLRGNLLTLISVHVFISATRSVSLYSFCLIMIFRGGATITKSGALLQMIALLVDVVDVQEAVGDNKETT